MVVAKTLAAATPALDFEIPLQSGDPAYVDLSSVRGGNAVGRLRRHLERQDPDRWLHAVFASHRGAGKSTELLHLQHDVSDHYFSIYFEANVEMDANSFSMEDMLLVIARVVEERMRQRGTPISDSELKKVESWFAEVVFDDEAGQKYLAGVQTEAKAEGGIPFVAKLLASVTASMKVESSHKESVKSTLKKYPGTLLTFVNNLLGAAARLLENDGLRLLLLIDNMDRYDPKVVDELLVASQDRFKALQCHLIVTPPIGLLVKPETQSIGSVFKCETMPTIKLREKTQSYQEFSGAGRELLLDVLGNRMDLEKLLPDLSAQDRLVAASGGGIRELLELAQDATLDAAGERLKLADVETALNRRRNWFRNMIDVNGWWPVLTEIAETKVLGAAPEFLEVVYQRLAFQYNGEVWYDVHPLVAELLAQREQRVASPAAKKAKPKKAAKKRGTKKGSSQ